MLWMVVPQDTMQAPPAPQAKDGTVAPEPPPPAAITEQTATEAKRERENAAPAPLQDRAQRAEERAADAVSPAAAAPPPPAPAAAPASPALSTPAPMLQKNAGLAAAPLEVVSPDPARRWRIANGAIERSEDGGASWTRIQPLADTITGGTAPTRSICWLIGANGAVFVTTDGVTFARVPLPEPVDLTAITATDAQSATVTTADGRRFRTDDSGRTWRQIQA
jgi:hypothetical protein